MTDTEIIKVLRESLWDSAYGNADPGGCRPLAGDILAALRDAGLEIVPTDTARLGQAVQATEYATGSPARIVLDVIYAEARVERP